MNIHSIDLTVTPGTLSLRTDQGIQTEFLHNQRSQGTDILPIIHTMLTQASTHVRDLAELWVVLGPGSFTGIRISVATALGLAAPHAIQVYGVTAFAAMACKAVGAGAQFPFCTAQQSHQGDYFCQYWRGQGECDTSYQGVIPADVPVYLRGNMRNDRQGDKAEGVPELSVTSHDVLAMRDDLCAGRYQQTTLEPFYIRPPDVTLAQTV